ALATASRTAGFGIGGGDGSAGATDEKAGRQHADTQREARMRRSHDHLAASRELVTSTKAHRLTSRPTAIPGSTINRKFASNSNYRRPSRSRVAKTLLSRPARWAT